MVVSENTESILLEEVMLEVYNITEFYLTNSMKLTIYFLIFQNLSYFLLSFNILIIISHWFSHPGHFGKIGQRHLHFRKNKVFRPTANVENVWPLALKSGISLEARADGKVPVLDLTRSGVYKCLGKGRLPKTPLIVKAKFFSIAMT